MPQVTISTDDLVSVTTAAHLLGRPRITIYRWVEKDKIAAIKLGGVLFIPRNEVERLKKERG
ncbi:MAG: hypothetical protein DDT27_01107 [Dehalococcoidia bacterium]|nr:hypothetical protein [Chloroflexota bacterium]MBT9162549.1 hypothetical protein [Chloroflexota bacterium]